MKTCTATALCCGSQQLLAVHGTASYRHQEASLVIVGVFC